MKNKTFQIKRDEHEKNFTIINNNFLLNKDLSLKAKGLFAIILMLPNNFNFSLKALSKFSTDGIYSIRKSIQELEKFGYIEKIQKKENLKNVFFYKITEKPLNKKIAD